MTTTDAAGAADGAPVVRRATRAVYVAFIMAGFGFASWAARIPQIRDQLGLTPGALGLVLLCAALGSLAAMPTTGFVVSRIGEARTVAIMSSIVAAGLVLIAVGYQVGTPLVAIGFVVIGLGNGSWDVAMNVQGAAVERELGRSIMSRFHAGFSVGTVAGAGVGAALVALHVSVTAHLIGVAVVVAASVPVTVSRGFLAHVVVEESHQSRRSALAAWRDPRTLLIGVFVLCMTVTEGTGNDWLSLSMVDGYGRSNTVGAVTLAVFLAAMTLGRWFGPGLLDRYGRVAVLRVCGLSALVGLALVVFGHVYPLALIGTVLWGVGASLGFPTGMSAAADDPAHAAARVSVAASIGYVAFLAGPPTIGFVADHTGVLHALTVVAGLLVVAMLISGVTAPLQGEQLDPQSDELRTSA